MVLIVLLFSSLVLLLAGLLLRTGLLVIAVRGQSMSPTLEPGDRILLVRRWLAGRLHKGQVVVVTLDTTFGKPRNSSEWWEASYYAKRVVATAGETFSAVLSANTLWEIEPASRIQPAQSPSQVEHWQIPDDHVFVCGDNWEESIDSRSWGPLPLSSVLGIMVMKLSPSISPSSASGSLPKDSLSHLSLSQTRASDRTGEP